jgi:hypothetical protein
MLTDSPLLAEALEILMIGWASEVMIKHKKPRTKGTIFLNISGRLNEESNQNKLGISLIQPQK